MIEAAETIEIKVPVVVRLEGTNAIEAGELLNTSNMDVIVATTLEDAAHKVVNTLRSK